MQKCSNEMEQKNIELFSGGTTISDVMRQRYFDLCKREISQDILTQVEEVYTKKKEVSSKIVQIYGNVTDMPGKEMKPRRYQIFI